MKFFFELSVLGMNASFFLYRILSFLWRGNNLLAISLSRSRVSLYMSMISFIFLLSVKLFSFKQATSFLASLSCQINLLKVGLLGGVLMLIISIGFSVDSPLDFFFLLNRGFGHELNKLPNSVTFTFKFI